jgi:hypothetical protein
MVRATTSEKDQDGDGQETHGRKIRSGSEAFEVAVGKEAVRGDLCIEQDKGGAAYDVVGGHKAPVA